MMTLSAAQRATLRQCAEEECSVIELLQEVHTSGSPIDNTRVGLVEALHQLAAEQCISFFLDEFATASTRPIGTAEALERLTDAASWDMHNPTQVHVRCVGV